VEALGWWDAIPATANGMAAAPARTNHTPGAVATALAQWSVRNGTPPYLPLCLVRTDVSNSLKPV
jgi:hypothetical protein